MSLCFFHQAHLLPLNPKQMPLPLVESVPSLGRHTAFQHPGVLVQWITCSTTSGSRADSGYYCFLLVWSWFPWRLTPITTPAMPLFPTSGPILHKHLRISPGNPVSWRSVLETQYPSDVQWHQGALWWLVLRDAWKRPQTPSFRQGEAAWWQDLLINQSPGLLRSLLRRVGSVLKAVLYLGCGGGGLTVLWCSLSGLPAVGVGSLRRRFSQGLASWRKEGLLNSVAPKPPFYFLC